MLATEEYSTLKLVLRSLTPSSISVMLCLCGGLFIVALHFLMLSINEGAFLPQLFDGEWAAFYTNTILRPVLVFLNNSTVSLVFVAVSWAVIGLIFYTVTSTIGRTIHNIRESRRETQMVGEFTYRAHPLEKSVLGQLLWRFFIGMIMVGLIIVLQSVIKHFLAMDERIFSGELSISASVRWMLGGVFAWSALMQIYVILLRFYLLRTRVFGELLY